MKSIPAVIKQRWASRNLVGDAKHQLIVRVRRGYMNRLYQPMQMLSNGRRPKGLPVIWKGQNMNPWQGQWTPEGPWTTLPEIESVKWTRTTQSDNGSSTATIVMDDIAFQDTEGVLGLYHIIERGYFSPQKGVKVITRPALWKENAWGDVLNGGYQVEVWEGYGPDGDPSVTPLAEPVNGSCAPPNAAITRTWTGLIDACDIDTHPDKLTITARDFGIFLTDQRLVYQNKAPEIHSPVVFADRATVLGEKPAGYGPQASSTHAGYALTGVTSTRGDAPGWVSGSAAAPTDMQYIEIRLPAGSYSQFYLATEAPGQSAYIAIKAWGDCRWNGAVVQADAWIGGSGPTVPDGTPYVNHYQSLPTGGKRLNLGGDLQCSDGTVLRIYLTNLNTNIYDASGNQIAVPGYVADVYRLWAYRYGKTADAPVPVATGLDYKNVSQAQGWVLIDDVADIVRMIFTWAGFKEWNVDDVGWSIKLPFNFGQDQFFIDVITSIMNQGHFVFFMDAPTDHDMSIGVPSFKYQQAVNVTPAVVATVRDHDLLESLTVKWDLSNLPYSIRIRGSIDKHGSTFGQDLSKRYMGTYFPPWSGIDYRKISPTRKGLHMDHSERLAGLKRNYINTQGEVISMALNSNAECLFAAVLTAVQYALGMTTAQFQMSGLPGVSINDAIVVVDEGSGTNSRISVHSVESDHNMAESGSWHMTISGVLLDTEDLSLISEDWAYVNFKYGMSKG